MPHTHQMSDKSHLLARANTKTYGPLWRIRIINKYIIWLTDPAEVARVSMRSVGGLGVHVRVCLMQGRGRYELTQLAADGSPKGWACTHVLHGQSGAY